MSSQALTVTGSGQDPGTDIPRWARDTAYRGASAMDAEVSAWLAWRQTADADLLPEMGTLAGRSLDLLRNHGISAGIINTIVDNVVGHTWRLRAQPDADALGMTESYAEGWSRDAEAIWRQQTDTVDWSADRKLTFLGQTRLLLATELVEGEALTLPLYMSGEGRTGPLGTRMQLIEPARLQNPAGKINNAHMRNGIEIDDFGAPQSYWIRKVSPNDPFLLFSNLMGGPSDYEQIPAYFPWGRKRVIHLHQADRIGQSHGKPAMSPVLGAFRMLDNYEKAELQGAVVQSRIAAIMTSQLPPEALIELFGGKAENYLNMRDTWEAQLRAGAIIQAFPGDKLETFNPSRPTSGFTQFCDHIARRCGLPVGLPLELTTKDFSNTNYSSARASLLEAWRSFLSRRVWLATYWADPSYQLVLEDAVNSGLLKAPTFYQQTQAWCQCSWTAAGRGWVDPVKEAQASQLRVAGNLSSLQAECAEQGVDWRENLRQRARELLFIKELEDEFGISLTTPIPKAAGSATAIEDLTADQPPPKKGAQ